MVVERERQDRGAGRSGGGGGDRSGGAKTRESAINHGGARVGGREKHPFSSTDIREREKEKEPEGERKEVVRGPPVVPQPTGGPGCPPFGFTETGAGQADQHQAGGDNLELEEELVNRTPRFPGSGFVLGGGGGGGLLPWECGHSGVVENWAEAVSEAEEGEVTGGDTSPEWGRVGDVSLD